MGEPAVDLTADEMATLIRARNICAAKQQAHASLRAAVSVLSSVLAHTPVYVDDDPPVELR